MLVVVAAVSSKPVGTRGAEVSVQALVKATIDTWDERLPAASYAWTPSE